MLLNSSIIFPTTISLLKLGIFCCLNSISKLNYYMTSSFVLLFSLFSASYYISTEKFSKEKNLNYESLTKLSHILMFIKVGYTSSKVFTQIKKEKIPLARNIIPRTKDINKILFLMSSLSFESVSLRLELSFE